MRFQWKGVRHKDTYTLRYLVHYELQVMTKRSLQQQFNNKIADVVFHHNKDMMFSKVICKNLDTQLPWKDSFIQF